MCAWQFLTYHKERMQKCKSLQAIYRFILQYLRRSSKTDLVSQQTCIIIPLFQEINVEYIDVHPTCEVYPLSIKNIKSHAWGLRYLSLKHGTHILYKSAFEGNNNCVENFMKIFQIQCQCI